MSRKPAGWRNESARHSLASRGIRTRTCDLPARGTRNSISSDDDLPSSMLKRRRYFRGDQFFEYTKKGEVDHPSAKWMVKNFKKSDFSNDRLDWGGVDPDDDADTQRVWWSVWEEDGMQVLMPAWDYFNTYSIIGLIGTRKDVTRFLTEAVSELGGDGILELAIDDMKYAEIDDDAMMFYQHPAMEHSPEQQWITSMVRKQSPGVPNILTGGEDGEGWY